MRIGDTTVLFWADGAEQAYQGIFMGLLGSGVQKYTDDMLREKTQALLRGEKVSFDEIFLDPNRTFYILGISPNAARLSVRFFMKNTFGFFMKHVQNHHDRMQIAKRSFDTFETIPIWRMLQKTVNMNSRDKSPSPNMAGAVLQAVLNDTRYPATLLNNLMLRIRADREMNRERAAILKAYYTKNHHAQVPEEVLTLSLNRETIYTPYCLGRLFAVYEKIQKDANPNLNSTIKDKYFNSASATPAVIFPTIDKLSKSHMKKLHRDNRPLAIYLEKELSEITDKLNISYPLRMSLAEQGPFQIGYYHQNTAFYTKNQENTKNV